LKIFSFEQFTGYLAIGAIVIAALAVAVQAFFDITFFIKTLTSKAVWEVIIALPVLIFSYLIGVVFVRISTYLFDRLRKENIHSKVARSLRIYNAENNFIAGYYDKLSLELELVQASCPSVTLLSVGLMLKVIFARSQDIGGTLQHGQILFGFVAIAILLLVPVLVLLASKLNNEIKEIDKQLSENIK